MRYAPPRLRRAAARWLEHEAGQGPATPDDLAAASGRLLDRLSQRLAQVIGPAGVQAIWHRAVKLSEAELPFHGERLVPPQNSESLGQAFRAKLQGLESGLVRDATVTLVATFAGLLAAVIGERLAGGLLRGVWPDTPLPEVEPQEAEE